MTAPGQLDLEGNEAIDPRQVKVAKALWWNDAKRTWGEDTARERAKTLWPRMEKLYMATALVVLAALDKP